MSKVNYSAILANAVAAGEISKSDLQKVMNAMNNGRGPVDWSPIYNNYGVRISDSQARQGLAWLLNLWKTPAGKERKNHPFGWREIRTLETFEAFYLIDYYDNGNRYFSHFVPVYRVEGSEGSFDYLVKDGTAYIIG